MASKRVRFSGLTEMLERGVAWPGATSVSDGGVSSEEVAWLLRVFAFSRMVEGTNLDGASAKAKTG